MKQFLILGALLISTFTYAQTFKLSDQAEVSLLTISPGDDLYSIFGHSAVRVKDPIKGIDQNYNYGSFDFQTPGFYLKFLRGTLPYQISSYNFQVEYDYWTRRQGRGVIEQVLNLSQSQKQATFDFLQNNMKPQNRTYQYKFFYDNCSTRLRDIFESVVGDSLVFNENVNADSTYRQWIDLYAMKAKKSWEDYGMDLAIGVPADDTTNSRGAMFLPDNLMVAFRNAQVLDTLGNRKDFIKSEKTLYTATLEHSSAPFTPIIFNLVVLAIGLVVTWKSKKSITVFDKVLFSITGIAGIILLLLWFATNHGVTELNYNVLWCFALTLPAVWMKNKFTKYTFFLQLVFAVFLVMSFGNLPQSIHTAVLPLLAIIIIRSFKIWRSKLI